jgi:hypothetical protein
VNYYLQTQDLLKGHATNGELIIGLRGALDQSYSRVLKAASDEWQRRFGGKEPSDSCVSVRISSGGKSPARRLSERERMQRLGSGAA